MSPGVRLRDGVEVDLSTGETVAFDGRGGDGPTVLSHAHGDHLVDGEEPVVASPLTVALAAARRDGLDPTAVEHPDVELTNAGHIAGSRAASLTDPGNGRTYLYTGDCSTRDRFYLEGFDPPDADVLVVESTYGKPAYRFPPTDRVVAEIQEWLAETRDEVVVLFGYALGRAQTLQRILADTDRRVFVTDAVANLNEVIEEHLGVCFPARRFGDDVDLQPGDALVLPMQTTRLGWIDELVESHDAVTAGFSGWAADDSFVYRRGVDRGFVLSDHCDFDELVSVVRQVDPERVYTHHGFAEAFADHLTTEFGYETRALKRNQSTLADY